MKKPVEILSKSIEGGINVLIPWEISKFLARHKMLGKNLDLGLIESLKEDGINYDKPKTLFIYNLLMDRESGEEEISEPIPAELREISTLCNGSLDYHNYALYYKVFETESVPDITTHSANNFKESAVKPYNYKRPKILLKNNVEEKLIF